MSARCAGCGSGRPKIWRGALMRTGFAISRVDEEEALATRALLEQLGAEYEQELDELKASAIE